MSHISIKVEGMAGHSVLDVLSSMLDLSRHLQIMVTSKMQGRMVIVLPQDQLDDLYGSWEVGGKKPITGRGA